MEFTLSLSKGWDIRIATLAPHCAWHSEGVRKYTIPQTMTLEYFLGDHLGSTSITTDNTGAKVSEMRYRPFGELRYSWTNAPVTSPSYALSRYLFTGQYGDTYINIEGAGFYQTSIKQKDSFQKESFCFKVIQRSQAGFIS